MTLGQDYAVAVVMATEVPPVATGTFTASMIPLALRAVADVIRNRAASGQFPTNPVLVALQPNQFSAVCRQEYWRSAMAGLWEPAHVTRALDIWNTTATEGSSVGKALWYYSPISMSPPMSEPAWLLGKTEVLLSGVSRDYFRFYQ